MFSSNSFIYVDGERPILEEFSIEITIGDGWNDRYSQEDKRLWKIEQHVTLRAHGSIVVEASEEIRVPYNRYGILLPTGSLFLGLGVLIVSAKIEPAFHGKIKIRMYNTTDRSITINKGTKVGSIIFMATDSTSQLPNVYRTSELSTSTIPHTTRIRKWVSSNKISVIGWIVSILSSSMLAALITYFIYYKPLIELQSNQLKTSPKTEINR